MSLSDAMQDLKNAVINGAALADDLFAEIAADYDLNPKLLARKAQEAGWTETSLRAIAAATSPEIVFAEKVKATTEEYVAKYGNNRFTGIEFFWHKTRYIYIGSYNANEHLCVREDGVARLLNGAALAASTYQTEALKRV